MTPTDFEHGQFVARLAALEHRLKSTSTAIALLADEQDILSAKLQKVRVELRTTLSVLGCVGSVLAYLFR